MKVFRRISDKIKAMRKRPFKRYMRYKLALLFFIVTLALFVLLIIISNLSKNEDRYSVKVLSQRNYSSSVLVAKRGNILDRNHTLLAASEQTYILILDPKVIYTEQEFAEGEGDNKVKVSKQPYLEPTINALVENLGLDRESVMEQLEGKKDKSYLRLKTNGAKTVLTYDQKTAFDAFCEEMNKEYADVKKEENINKTAFEKAQRIKGVWFETEYRRVYPYNSAACSVLGFTTGDGSTGLWGLESYYNKELAGVNGREYGYVNEDFDLVRQVEKPQDGSQLVSTLDLNMQNICQKHIDEFMETYTGKVFDEEGNMKDQPAGEEQTPGAENIGVLVMNPNNGEVLAMATNSTYDLNHPNDILKEKYTAEELSSMDNETQLEKLNQIWRNFCISDTFEPGSTAKPLTISAALEEGAVKEDETFTCDGFEMVAGWRIKCHVFPDYHGELDLSGALEESCNDSLMQIVKKLGAPAFAKYQRLFGLNRRTGIDLPGEAAGILYQEEKLKDAELATGSFGQGFTVTMVELASAISSAINGGYYYQPHLVKQVLDSKGAVIDNKESVPVSRVVSEETSKFIREALYQTVNQGTGGVAKIDGYKIGGKTGTAEKLPRGNGKYVISFISFAPADNPELLLYVVIDTPNVNNPNSSEKAQLVAKAIWEELLPYANIYSSEAEDENKPEGDGQEQWQGQGIMDQEDPNAQPVENATAESAETQPMIEMPEENPTELPGEE
ncbi:stage V sporulation protein D (sporulation-specific penicillin-binding protein) [Cuneatibacter caecimuris]|uniref:Stage V sporulation protein D (Sporulation-specific penicillin-binding protein) n=2 Tax=Cuneatibacter caecimuris TaxID=1796618 RepID=A0A4Q7PLE5_9FIRM|nr:stage V sporulation protein D (sporulation-specific penicillin-binding protein) [Cuneatibacter caecimuris]